jgi:manganese transport protein
MLLGPAFVAAVAYVDPGNVATNLTAGARYGYLLVWVLVVATAMAGLVQYLSAKVGVVTGRTVPELLRERLPASVRIGYWLQAEGVALATDIAEVVGGAIALALLFGLPLPLGGLITGVVSMAILGVQDRRGQRSFERVITACLAVIAVGFVAGLLVAPPEPGAVAGGLRPAFAGMDSVLLAVGMVGATVMPHAVYLHSALVRDRFGRTLDPARLLRATRRDVALAMLLAGGVNIALLLLAAGSLQDVPGADTIEGAYAAVVGALGPGIGMLLAIGLLVSGLASTSVGCYAGAVVMQGLLIRRVPLLMRRLVTLIPAVVLLALGADPTLLLVISQVALSFGIPFVLVPLVILTADRGVMGSHVNRRLTSLAATGVAGIIIVLNVTLVALTFGFLA